jgi:hypothetical protein
LGLKLKLALTDVPLEFSWLSKLCAAAAAAEEETSLKLVKYGWRRGATFFVSSIPTPFFGLCNPLTIRSLHQEDALECGVEFIRQHLSILQ